MVQNRCLVLIDIDGKAKSLRIALIGLVIGKD
jgi:hypothetical protein